LPTPLPPIFNITEESTQRMIEEEESAIRSRNPNHHDGDHSLDHYFDHQLNSNNRHGSSYNNSKKEKEKEREERKPALRAAELTSVRGGGVTERRRNGRLVQSPAFVTTDKKGDIWSPRDGRSSQKRHSSRKHHSRDFEEEMYDSEEEDYDDEDVQDMLDEGEEYEQQQQHHLGLLRVPCSIAVNCGEATHHASSHGTSLKSWVLNAHTTHIHFFLTLISQNS